MRQPIIFIGMHRSGTSMLGRLLDRLGLFSGTHKDENNEAIYFQKLNCWMMLQCGARWDIPDATRYLWGNEELLAWVEDYIRYYLNSPRSIYFLGLRRYFTMGGFDSLNLPWGWKDPRNTITLPLWLRIFPDAKIVHIERHGVDVANSLLERDKRTFDEATNKYRNFKKLLFLRPMRRGFLESPRCASLEGGFSLWKEYNLQAKKNLQHIPNERVLNLRYEDILNDPVMQLNLIVSFCGLDVSEQAISAATININSSRAYSYLNNRELYEFASTHQSDLKKFGYDSN